MWNHQHAIPLLQLAALTSHQIKHHIVVLYSIYSIKLNNLVQFKVPLRHDNNQRSQKASSFACNQFVQTPLHYNIVCNSDCCPECRLTMEPISTMDK